MLGAGTDGPATASESIPLTLDEAVARAVEQNLAVQSQALDWRIAKWALRKERAVFEPEFVGSGRRESNSRENTVEQTRSQLATFFEEENTRYDAGVEGLLPLGTRVRVGYSLNDLSNNLTNGTVRTEFQDQYQSFAGVTLRQPLLKNSGRAATMAAITLAGIGMDVAVEDYRRKLMQIVAQTEVAYWNLAFAENQLALRTNSVGIAEKLLVDNRARVKAGRMSEMEVLQAEAGVALRRTRVQEARRDWIEALDQLRTFFSVGWNDARGSFETTSRPELRAIPSDFAKAMSTSLALHPDYRKAMRALDQENVRVKYMTRQRWPEVDLVASYGYNGLGDSVGTSWDDVSGRDFESWAAGVEMRIPLGGGRRDLSDLKIAALRKERALLDLKTVEIAIGNALHAAEEKVALARRSVEDNRQVLQFTRKELDVELQRLAAGTSNSRKVLEVEDDLLSAQIAEWRGLADYQRALVEWQLATGLILADRGFDVLQEGDAADYARLRRLDALETPANLPLSAPARPADGRSIRPDEPVPRERGGIPPVDAPHKALKPDKPVPLTRATAPVRVSAGTEDLVPAVGTSTIPAEQPVPAGRRRGWP